MFAALTADFDGPTPEPAGMFGPAGRGDERCGGGGGSLFLGGGGSSAGWLFLKNKK
jgi:hypothetical protein